MLWSEEDAIREYDEPAWTLWSMLAMVHGFWSDIYRQYWAVDGHTRPDWCGDLDEDYQTHFELGARVRAMATSLSVTAALNDGVPAPTFTESQQKKALRQLLADLAKHTVVRHRIAFDIANEELARLRDAEIRAGRLARLVHGRGLAVRASHYIERATRLYIAGFEVEAAIMCRSALEGALAECLAEYFDQDRKTPGLDVLLGIAGEREILDGYEAASNEKGWRAKRDSPLWRAEQIKWLGNHLIHHAPDWSSNTTTIRNAFEAIRELSAVLGYLFPAPTFE